jgi:hypothetical protein
VKVVGCAVALVLMWVSPAVADCKSEVDDAFAKLRQGKSFRLTTKIVNPQGTLNMQVDYALPDRMHQRVRLGESPAEMETVAIGEKVWSNQGQGWAEVPKSFADEIVKQIKQTVAEPAQSKIDYGCLGDKEFEGKVYKAYAAKLPPPEQAKNDAPVKATVQTLYVDRDSGLPARNIVAAVDTPDARLFDGTFSTPEGIDIKEPSVAPPVPNQ